LVELSCTLVTAGSSVMVRYAVTNRSPRSVFVANLVQDATFKQHPSSAYTALAADGKRLNLLLSTSPLPADLDVEFSVPALYRKLLSGEFLSGELRLSVPIDEWDAYHLPDPRVEVDLVETKEIALLVAVAPDHEAGAVEPFPSAPGHYRISCEPQLFSCSVVVERSLTVRKRRGELARS
jgi:hypothetical protein